MNIKNKFFIMAGGRGRRLMPYTKNCPKPMLKLRGKPILEHILTKAKILNPSYNSMYEMAKLCISKGMTKKSILDILQKVDYLEIMETLIKVSTQIPSKS